MKIFIDNREKNMIRFLNDVFEDYTLTQLFLGDYLIVTDSNGILIERKTVTDFWSSIKSNRLWDQLLRMMKIKEILGYKIQRRMLLIHGNLIKYFETQFQETENNLLSQWSQLMGAYQEIIYVYNTPIFHAESNIAFKAFMKILAKREYYGKNDKLPEARWYKKPVKADLPKMDRKKYILSSFPFIGDVLANNLLFHFQTISAIANASIEELKEVPKIGKKRANIIHMLFHS